MDGDQLVAFAKWQVPADIAKDIPGEMQGGESESLEIPKRPEGADDELWKRFRKGIDEMRGRWSDCERDFGKF